MVFKVLLLLLLSHVSRVQLCVTPQTAAHQAPPSLGFSRKEHFSNLKCYQELNGASLVAQLVKNLPAVQKAGVQSLVWEDPLEKGKVTHSSILAWRSPWGHKESGRTERLSLEEIDESLAGQGIPDHTQAFPFNHLKQVMLFPSGLQCLLTNQLISLCGFPCILFVAFFLLFLIFLFCL